jgi:hypothetical protein
MYDGSICYSKSKLFAVCYTLKHLVYSTFFICPLTNSLECLVVRLLMNEFKIGVTKKVVPHVLHHVGTRETDMESDLPQVGVTL